MVRALRFLLLGVLVVQGIFPQDGGTTGEDARSRRLLVFFDAGEGASFTKQELRLIYGSLLSAVHRAAPSIVILEHGRFDHSLSRDDMAGEARSVGAHAMLSVEVKGTMESIRVRASAYDFLRDSGRDLATASPDEGVPFRLIDYAYWTALAEPLEGWNDPVTDTVELTIKAPPDADIFGVAGEPLRTGPEGIITVKVRNPATLTVRTKKEGFYDGVKTVYVGYDPVSLVFDPIPYGRWGAELLVNNLQFLGARATWHPVPADLFLRGGIVTYAAGIYLVPGADDGTTPDLFQFNPMTLFTLQGGKYFTSPSRDFRPYGSAGVFFRFRHDGGISVDTIAPFGLSAALGLEYSPFPKVRFFLEYEPLVYFPTSVDDFITVSFPEGYYDGRSIPGYLVGDSIVADMRNTHIGIRILF